MFRGAAVRLFVIALVAGAVTSIGHAAPKSAAAAAIAPAMATAVPAVPVVLAAPAVTAPATAPRDARAVRFAADPVAVKRGRQVFIGTCGAYCHSTHDQERDAPSLYDCTWRHGSSDQQIFDVIANGVPNSRMPAWKGVLPQGDDDIWRVIAYLRTASVCQAGVAAH